MSAWTVIAHTEVGSGGAANITFSSIPASYTDLYLALSLRTAATQVVDAGTLYFNASTSGYSMRRLAGDGSAAYSDTTSNRLNGTSGSRILFSAAAGNNATASTFANVGIYIPNYTSSVAKSVSIDGVTENNATASDLGITVGLWTGTATISTITFEPYYLVNWSQYSSATLWGITKGSSGGVSVS